MTPRLRCNGIRHSYSENHVLRGVDLTVGDGETLAVMGRSGCGKSTLLRCIAMLEYPSHGNCELEGQEYMNNGRPLFSPAQVRSQIQMVFQEYNLFPNMTALRNVTLALEETRKLPADQAKELALDVASKLGIEKVLGQYPDTLSGGQAQRLALARAMVLQPSVLLLDEITSALDPESIANVVEAILHIRGLDGRGGLGIVVVTHLLRFALRFADRVAYLKDGQIVDLWPAADFVRSCRNPEAREFVQRAELVG